MVCCYGDHHNRLADARHIGVSRGIRRTDQLCQRRVQFPFVSLARGRDRVLCPGSGGKRLLRVSILLEKIRWELGTGWAVFLFGFVGIAHQSFGRTSGAWNQDLVCCPRARGERFVRVPLRLAQRSGKLEYCNTLKMKGEVEFTHGFNYRESDSRSVG